MRTPRALVLVADDPILVVTPAHRLGRADRAHVATTTRQLPRPSWYQDRRRLGVAPLGVATTPIATTGSRESDEVLPPAHSRACHQSTAVCLTHCDCGRVASDDASWLIYTRHTHVADAGASVVWACGPVAVDSPAPDRSIVEQRAAMTALACNIHNGMRQWNLVRDMRVCDVHERAISMCSPTLQLSSAGEGAAGCRPNDHLLDVCERRDAQRQVRAWIVLRDTELTCTVVTPTEDMAPIGRSTCVRWASSHTDNECQVCRHRIGADRRGSVAATTYQRQRCAGNDERGEA
jgi:hypothetical protein